MIHKQLQIKSAKDIIKFATLCTSDLYVDLSEWPNLQTNIEELATTIHNLAECDRTSKYYKIFLKKINEYRLNNHFDFIDLIILLDLIYHTENPVEHFKPQINIYGTYKEKTSMLQVLFGVDKDYIEVEVKKHLQEIIEIFSYPINNFVEFRSNGVYLK